MCPFTLSGELESAQPRPEPRGRERSRGTAAPSDITAQGQPIRAPRGPRILAVERVRESAVCTVPAPPWPEKGVSPLRVQQVRRATRTAPAAVKTVAATVRARSLGTSPVRLLRRRIQGAAGVSVFMYDVKFMC
ncbi:hypothetical protein NDU88_004419 [Pleurodeles waltl]|uniref:Uncharacterized protein n=1 Tax=Pleurodeles waltl TaxID=8319 RepID=A0AAV7W9N9_PLEWA|nr:hypothetical protein NDU88_004419 [Pleurodeles waltl]